MIIKMSNLLAASAMAGLLCLGAGASLAADGGMKHSAADFNKDGMVTEDELVIFVRMHFMTMDKNNDHMVESAEWNDDWFLDQ